MNNAFYIMTSIAGLMFSIFHKRFGKSAVEFRKKIFKGIMPQGSFGKNTVIFTQIGFLIGGLIIFIFSVLKIFIS